MTCRGFQTSIRANPLAQQIVEGNINQSLTASLDFYSPDNCEDWVANIVLL